MKLLTIIFSLILLFTSTATSMKAKYNALFSFGDSMDDTGNICLTGNTTQSDLLTLTHPPYGMSYFGKPTCRWSDGRLVVDFIAQALALPLLPPSKAKGKDFRSGVNMAISGGTAMNFSSFQSLGVGDPLWSHGSLDAQIQWFEELIPSICGTKQSCKGFLQKSLFLVGTLGENDYNAMLLYGFTIEQGMNNTPKIVNAIADGVEKLITLGAVHIVVPGLLPTGCFPLFLYMFANSSSQNDFDQFGCLKNYNDLTKHHNLLLQKTLKCIQSKHKSARIMYADYYTQLYHMVQQPKKFGFVTAFEACCGAGGGKYNFDIMRRCGMEGSSACRNPATHLSWDGVHPTEAANQQIADAWLNGPYCSPPILAQALGLPLLPPSKRKVKISGGIRMAISGGTAMNLSNFPIARRRRSDVEPWHGGRTSRSSGRRSPYHI